MKRLLILLTALLSTAPLLAQYSPCYEAAFAEGQKQYNAGNYTQAKAYFNDAKDCPDPNAAAADEWIEKCDNKLKGNQNNLEIIELTIPGPNWNGKMQKGVAKDKFTLKEVINVSDPVTLSPVEWLETYNLKLEYAYYKYNNYKTVPDGKFLGYGEVDLDMDMGVFPMTYKGEPLKNYEFYDGWYAAFYSDDYWDYNYILIVDTKKNLMYQLDFTAFSMAPYTKKGDEDFVKQGVRNPHLVGDILYVQHGHNTYASSSGGKNAYISAIDLKNNKILWTTLPLTSNCNFVIVDNTIVCGYGFTSEARYVYLVDMATGKRRQTIRVTSSPSYIVREGNRIHIKCYDKYYAFDLINR